MLNGCKSCSIFAIQDIELYFIFIAPAWKHQPKLEWFECFIVDTTPQFSYDPAPLIH